MATITFLENAAFDDSSARDWLGWRSEADKANVVYTFPQGPNGPPTFNSDPSTYIIQTSNSAAWAGWILRFGGSFDAYQQHYLPGPGGTVQNIPTGVDTSGSLTSMEIDAPGTFFESGNLDPGPPLVSITGLSVDSNALAAISNTDYGTYVAALVAQFGGGNDTVNGSSRADLLNGYGGNDTIYGNGGNDTIDGGTGADAMFGGTGDDTFFVENPGDQVFENAGEGFDQVLASVSFTLGAGQEVERLATTNQASTDPINLTGNELSQELLGNQGANTLTGNGGNDTLNGLGGFDTLIGGTGDDAYILADATNISGSLTWDSIIEAQAGGTDTVQVSSTVGRLTYVLDPNVENAVVTGGSDFNLVGNELDNVLTGNGGANTLTGNDGADTLNGLGGFDTLIGGAGDDTYVLGDATNINGSLTWDTITEAQGGGTDTVQVSSTVGRLTYVLDPNVENAVVTGGSNFNLVGNELNNVLTGNGASNTLTGNAGEDTLNGLGGYDTLIGGEGNDTYVLNDISSHSYGSSGFTVFSTDYDNVVEAPSGGIDTVLIGQATGPSSINPGQTVTFTSYTLGANVDNGVVSGAAAFDLTGNELNNVLTGNNAANTLTGNAGNDTFRGLGGNDIINGGAGRDTAVYSGNRSAYTITHAGLAFTVSGGGDGTDTLTNVELLQFANGTVAVATLPPDDFNGDGVSDVLWANSGTGNVGEWQISGGHVTGWVPLGNGASPWSIAGTGDFNGDGTTDVLWRNSTSGDVGCWQMANNTPSWVALGNGAAGWLIAAVGDFNGDGLSDVLWRNSTSGDVGEWQMANGHVAGWVPLGNGAAGWQIAGIGDFNGDGTSDVLWNNSSTGDTGDWQMSNGHVGSWNALGNGASPYQIAGVGDFNGDGTSDVLWRNANTGDVGDWAVTNNNVTGWTALGNGASPYQIAGIGDYNGDGTSDVLWRNSSTGDVGDWAMTNNHVAGWNPLGNGAAGWQVVNS